MKNALVQFLFGAAMIVGGHSVDREGPSVHLGATCGSALGERGGLRHRDRRTLIACGVAASVAAAFNTPLAGAVFAIEVMGFRYNIARFMPVTMAAVIGAVVVRVAGGGVTAFPIGDFGIRTVLELPGIALLGVATGAVAGLFTAASQGFTRRLSHVGPAAGFALSGLVTGTLALAVPQIMGVGSDVLQAMLTRELPALLLLGIVLAKVLATSVAVGLRVPGGLIGPTLVIGGAMGGLAHFALAAVLPTEMAPPGFYAIIGMVAMMGAALHAPMAALIALLELTGTPGIILPGMLVMVTADAVYRLGLRRESIFVAVLRVLRAQQERASARVVPPGAPPEPRD